MEKNSLGMAVRSSQSQGCFCPQKSRVVSHLFFLLTHYHFNVVFICLFAWQRGNSSKICTLPYLLTFVCFNQVSVLFSSSSLSLEHKHDFRQHTRTCMHACTCVRMRTYTHTHTHAHAHCKRDICVLMISIIQISFIVLVHYYSCHQFWFYLVQK